MFYAWFFPYGQNVSDETYGTSQWCNMAQVNKVGSAFKYKEIATVVKQLLEGK